MTLFLSIGLFVVMFSHQAFGYTMGPVQKETQQPRDAGSGAGDQEDVRALEPGRSIKRKLAGGQQHTYAIRLSADQFLRAIIEQKGIDVVVQVFGPDGKQIMEVDSERRNEGQESVSQVAEVAGDYRLTVQSKQKGASPGDYEIRIEELRDAKEDDRALHNAYKLYDESLKLQRAGKYDQARLLVEQTLEIRERVLGTDHRDVAAAINSLAVLYSQKGDFDKAEPLYQRALTIREKVLGPEHPDVAACLNNLAEISRNKGDYAKAEPLYERALIIREKTLGPEHPGVAGPLTNLAILYRNRGEYEKAETLQQRALAIRENSFGPEHPDVAASLDELALLSKNRGDYVKAEPLHRRALNIREKALGPEHPDLAISLNNLANLYGNKGEYEKAEPLFQRAITIREKTLGHQHPLLAASLNNLALLYEKKGDYAKAEPLFQQVLGIWEKTLGPLHPNVADTLNNLASLFRNRGEYAKAEPLYQRALAILEKVPGPLHPLFADTLNELAVLHMGKGDLAQAVALQSRANAVSEQNIVRTLVAGSERQKLAYLAALSKQVDQTISLQARYAPDDPAARKMAVTMILQRKGRALDAISQSLSALRDRFNAEDRTLLGDLTDTRSQIASLVLDGPRRMTAQQYRDRIEILEDRAEKIEAEISRRSDEFRIQYLPITLSSVQAEIPANAALIEFASYRPLNAKAVKDDQAYGLPHYVAYVVRRQGEIQWAELGEAKAIDETIAALRRALRNPKRKDVRRLARTVDQRIFQPIRPLVGKQTRLLISPEGALNFIPFAALVDEKGRYLVERYSISYLASGRDLLRLQVARESQTGPLVVADPDFGGEKPMEAARLLRQKPMVPKEQVKGESHTSAFSQFYFPALPHTAREGEALRALLPDATLLTKRQASKTALSRVHSPALLHIATHGFFLEDLKIISTGKRENQALGSDPGRLLRQIEKSGAYIESPLLRSGLALAGANEEKKEDNGILTALEVSGLNLWGTKLVVLSACDTGVGEVKNGDGVYGLRRALVLAGSETQVMSLWPVSDRWTRDLMVAYYQGLQRGEGRGEALRQVQLGMLKNVRRRHPYYWASFIQSGEWANLGGKR